MKLKRREAVRICREMWKELAETGAREKPEYTQRFYHQCPLCEYLKYTLNQNDIGSRSGEEACRKYCPLEWPGASETCFNPGLYHDWLIYITNKAKRKEIALQISELPYKPLPKRGKHEKDQRN